MKAAVRTRSSGKRKRSRPLSCGFTAPVCPQLTKLTILASNARPSTFVMELKKDPAYALAEATGADEDAHECGECGGRLLGRMVASGIAASISSIVATCCLPARPASRHCRVTPIDRQKFGAPAVPAIRPVRNAKMAGWWSAPAHTGVSSAVSGIRPAWVRRKYRQWQVLQANRSYGTDIWLAPGAQLRPFRIATDGHGIWHHTAAAKPCRSLKS